MEIRVSVLEIVQMLDKFAKLPPWLSVGMIDEKLSIRIKKGIGPFTVNKDIDLPVSFEFKSFNNGVLTLTHDLPYSSVATVVMNWLGIGMNDVIVGRHDVSVTVRTLSAALVGSEFEGMLIRSIKYLANTNQYVLDIIFA